MLYDLIVQETEVNICGWPTDTVSIRCHDEKKISSDHQPRYAIFFIPGNPGCVGWYITFLSKVLSELGPDYVAYGISYAGHSAKNSLVVGIDDNNGNYKREFPWTLRDQIDHKIEFISNILENHHTESTKLIFLSHSIGSHMVQRICLLREDFVLRTDRIIHLMPFFRFHPSLLLSQKLPLSFVAHMPKNVSFGLVEKACKLIKKLPQDTVFRILETNGGVTCAKGRIIALDLARSSEMAKNWLHLGIEELRDLPQLFDKAAMKVIENGRCPIFMLYCGGPDQWSPQVHMFELLYMQIKSEVPDNYFFHYNEHIIHGFVVKPEMIGPVAKFVVDSCRKESTRKILFHAKSKL